MHYPGDKLRIELRPSRLCRALHAILYAGALGCLAIIDAPPPAGFLLLALLILGAVCDGLDGAATGARVRGLTLVRDGMWIARLRGGRLVRGRPRAERLNHPLAVCITLVTARGGTLPLLILPDMLDAGAFRSLRVWLEQQSGH